MKNKFYKNLYQSISIFSVVTVFSLILLWGYIDSLSYGKNNGWILLVVAVSLIALFFVIGFYWIFQKVIINEKGIKIVFGKKILKECTWDGIESITVTNTMKNPAIQITQLNGLRIHLDERKSIIKVIELYYNGRVVK